jgi:hypothetical protein
VAYENNDKRIESVYSTRIKAGKRRTYFFDVRPTKANDFYLTITESRKKFDNGGGYDRHKIFLYKEDFNKFIKALTEAVDHVKTELMPDFDFDSFNHDQPEGYEGPEANGNGHDNGTPVYQQPQAAPAPAPPAAPVVNSAIGNTGASEEVDKW